MRDKASTKKWYTDICYQQNRRIKESRKRILQVDKREYPNLHRQLNGRARELEKLVILMDTMLESGRYRIFGKKAFFECSVRRLAKKGGHPGTWSRVLSYLSLLGLIEKCIVQSGRGVRSNKRQGLKLPCAYHIPTYSKAVFREAERLATLPKSSGRGFTKAGAILTYGQVAADRAFGDARLLSGEFRAIVSLLETMLYELMESRDYITKADLIEATAANLDKIPPPELPLEHIGRAPWGMKHVKAFTAEELDHEFAKHDYNPTYCLVPNVDYIERTWSAAKMQILTKGGFKWGRPTNAEKEAFGINSNEWIIRKTANN